jgi:hypothetical protein
VHHRDHREQPPELTVADAPQLGGQRATVDRARPAGGELEVGCAAFVRHLLGQVVRGLQEGAAAAGGDVVFLGHAVDAAVVGEEVRVAGQEQRHGGVAGAHDAREQLAQARVVLLAFLAQLPQGHGRAQDDAVAGREQRGGLREVRLLFGVERVVECGVDAPHPPAVRQLHHPPAFGLRRLPVADEVVGLDQQLVEQRDAAVPVVVAGDGHQGGRGGRGRWAVGLCLRGQQVGQLGLLPVPLACCVGVHLVAAHHQQPAAGKRGWGGRQLAVAVVGQVDRGSGQLPRDRRGGVERVAEVADVVDPQRAVVAGGQLDGHDGVAACGGAAGALRVAAA